MALGGFILFIDLVGSNTLADVDLELAAEINRLRLRLLFMGVRVRGEVFLEVIPHHFDLHGFKTPLRVTERVPSRHQRLLRLLDRTSEGHP